MAKRAEEILDAIRGLPEGERRRLVIRLRRAFGHGRGGESATFEDLATLLDEGGGVEDGQQPGSIVGLFADEADLIDEVCEAAMAARERDTLRIGDG